MADVLCLGLMSAWQLQSCKACAEASPVEVLSIGHHVLRVLCAGQYPRLQRAPDCSYPHEHGCRRAAVCGQHHCVGPCWH